MPLSDQMLLEVTGYLCYPIEERGETMHVGCCENCRYIDLVENWPDGCPRCGGQMVSLCVDTDHWNRMNMEGRKSLIMNILTEPKLRPASMPEFEMDPDIKEEVISELVQKADTRDIQVRRAREALHEARRAEQSVENVKKKAANDTINEHRSTHEYVFVCSRCNGIAAHLRTGETYTCEECGSQMLDSGYRTTAWASLTKEEKRDITSEAQLQHIIQAIKQVSADDADEENIQNIVNVVADE